MKKVTLSNKVYNVLKWLALIGLPAMGTLYYALSSIWGLPYAEQVMGTKAALATFLGLVLGISSSNYNKNVANESPLSGVKHNEDSSQ